MRCCARTASTGNISRATPMRAGWSCAIPALPTMVCSHGPKASLWCGIARRQRWPDWAGRRYETMVGRPVAMHAMRGISAHSNGFHTCRALHILQILLGAIDCPGGFRYEAPFPRPCPAAPPPSGKTSAPMQPLEGMPLGHPCGPEDLLVDAAGEPLRIDKAYSWEAPLAAHGLMHMVVRNAWAGDPYPIDTLFLYMSNL